MNILLIRMIAIMMMNILLISRKAIMMMMYMLLISIDSNMDDNEHKQLLWFLKSGSVAQLHVLHLHSENNIKERVRFL